MAKIRDMTTGRPAGLILRFALPLLLGNTFQQVYALADAAIVGNFVGVQALAALGAAEWTNWLVQGLISGFTQGFSVRIAQRFGAGDWRGLRQAIAQSILLSAALAGGLLLLSQLLLLPTLRLLQTPESVFFGAELYLRVLFAGIPIITAYNMLVSILRALGDGRTPLRAMLVAAAVNVALDVLLVVVFRLGLAGVAAATLAAQVVASLLCLRAVLAQRSLRIEKALWRPDGEVLRRLVALGTPMALQNSIIAVGGMVLQYVINGFGFLFVAGFTATNKLYGVLELAAIPYGFSMTTFAGQNRGAGRLDRVRQGVRAASVVGVVTAMGIGACMLLFGRSILLSFLSGTQEQIAAVLEISWRYLSIMSAQLVVLYMLHVYRAALIGLGDTVMPMMSGIAEFAMRVGAALLLPIWLGSEGLYWAEVSAWAGAALLLALAYFRRMRLLERDEAPTPRECPSPEGI